MSAKYKPSLEIVNGHCNHRHIKAMTREDVLALDENKDGIFIKVLLLRIFDKMTEIELIDKKEKI